MESQINKYAGNLYECPKCGQEIVKNSYSIKKHNKNECKGVVNKSK